MDFKQTSDLLTALSNITLYAEAQALEYQKEYSDLMQIDRYEAKIAKAKQTVWDIANA